VIQQRVYIALMRALFALLATLIAGVPLEAAEPAQSATVIGPNNAHLAAGAQALENGQAEEGIRLTHEGLRAPNKPEDVAAGHSNLCAGYGMLKRWDEALKHCNAALALDRTNWRTFNNRAAVYTGKGLYELALTDLQSGLELAPESRTLKRSLQVVEENKRAHKVHTSIRG
jgi:tetratricopeptide (TPR) repeat protein